MKTFSMIKLVALILVLGTILSCILTVTDAYEREGNFNKFGSDPEITSVNDFSRDKFPKKFNKEKEKKNFYPGKESHYKQDDHFERKEMGKRFSNQNDFREFHKNEKFSKYDRRGNHHEDLSRDKNVNYHDEMAIHEKEKSNEEEKYEQKIVGDKKFISLHHDIDVDYLHPPKKSPDDVETFGDKKFISLHHDIDVNYLHPPKKSPDDVETFGDKKFISLHHDIDVNYPKKSPHGAELINLEEIAKNHKKKANYKSLNGSDRKGRGNFYKNLKEIDFATIPSPNKTALVARYIIHKVDWTALGTLSTNIKLKGSPFVNVLSVSDGPDKKGSGVPFFYMTPKDFSSLDLEKDNRSCMTVTLAQTSYCENRYDPESPLCARLILCGKIKKIKSGSEEEDFARLALFSRHPEMEKWPADHDWFFSKLKIKQIILINHFGGASYISLQDYFSADSA